MNDAAEVAAMAMFVIEARNGGLLETGKIDDDEAFQTVHECCSYLHRWALGERERPNQYINERIAGLKAGALIYDLTNGLQNDDETD